MASPWTPCIARPRLPGNRKRPVGPLGSRLGEAERVTREKFCRMMRMDRDPVIATGIGRAAAILPPSWHNPCKSFRVLTKKLIVHGLPPAPLTSVTREHAAHACHGEPDHELPTS